MKIKIISCLLILLTLITLTGCKKEHIINDGKEFLDIYYEYYAGYEGDFVAVDLRDYNTLYVEGHLKGFISYDYYPNLIDGDINNQTYTYNFVEWLTLNYGKNNTIFLVDVDGEIVDTVLTQIKGAGYENIYAYSKGYDRLLEYNDGAIEIATGESGCDC